MSRSTKRVIIWLVDTLMILAANFIAYLFMEPLVSIKLEQLFLGLAVQLVIYWTLATVLNIFNRVNRQTNTRELILIFVALLAASIGELVGLSLLPTSYSIRFVSLSFVLSVLSIFGSRIVWRLMVEYRLSKHGHKEDAPQTLIIGVGAGGDILMNALEQPCNRGDINVVGFADDDLDKKGTYFHGKKVLGTLDDIAGIVDEYSIEQLTVAIPSLESKGYQKIVDIAQEKGVKVNSMPSIEDITSGKVSVNKFREVDVVDLLGREEVKLDMDVISKQLTNKTILITGAGGSIGSEIARQVMKFSPKRLLLLGHGENSIYLIDRELKQLNQNVTEIIPVIADVQDRKRMFEIMNRYKPEQVYHAAAHKHVPLMEYNPKEALKNNVYGTKNVAEAALEAGVESFVMVSTDKATNPPNVMGATKRLAEMIVTGLNKHQKTKFSAVRFGNVLGSRGSVIPVFKDQIAKGGPLTVTDFRMTRYFMTIPEASRLVLQSGALAKGGEIFILDMGEPVKIYDLAKNVIKLSGYSVDEIGIIETGIRPGEKLYEELLVDKERAEEQVFEKIFVGNIKGFSYDEVLDRISQFSDNPDEMAKQVVALANESIN
ncbi:polysaccharide biosynthesis protein [Vagococcus zengguangii]|uniref:polysaccharide biosynthesis protein n=1 Tax=Vagococcus zengguangii TaxID=2571750 RepID=UPI0020163672|nr:nucleoside-diphosphate sugar epimerase/dehydratase [Vagococcus zengguangii]